MPAKTFDITTLFTDSFGLQPLVVKWLHEAMGFDLDVIQQTRFVKVDQLRYHAQTFYKTVRYQNPAITTNATHHYTLGDWLNLIAHEMQHRQDIGNNVLTGAAFGLSYGYHWAKNWVKGKNPYHDNPHELCAFDIGCSNDSKVNRWLRENPDFSLG